MDMIIFLTLLGETSLEHTRPQSRNLNLSDARGDDGKSNSRPEFEADLGITTSGPT